VKRRRTRIWKEEEMTNQSDEEIRSKTTTHISRTCTRTKTLTEFTVNTTDWEKREELKSEEKRENRERKKNKPFII
jgi:hypothetical protein